MSIKSSRSENSIFAPGSTIGIVGGGQLGRMLALGAAQLGMKTAIYCPDPLSPAFDVTPLKFVASYDDEEKLAEFARSVDVITYEFENLPVGSVEFLQRLKPVAPGPRVLAVAQDRLKEKSFLRENSIRVADFCRVENFADLEAAIFEIGLPAVLKTATMGYDGKGQRIIRLAEEAAGAFDELKGGSLVLEAFIPFEREISVVVARNENGEIRDYEPSENLHRDHILKTSTLPANIDEVTRQNASDIAHDIVKALNYVGVLAIEYFVVSGNPHATLIVNEIAPRVHNSGHWTKAVCPTDQFEQHIRAICNWPLGDTSRIADVVMENLIGEEIENAHIRLESGIRPEFYGKKIIRPGRKMGHLCHIDVKTARK